MIPDQRRVPDALKSARNTGSDMIGGMPAVYDGIAIFDAGER